MLLFLILSLVLAAGSSSSSKGSFEVRAKVLSGWPETPSAAQSLEWIRDVDSSQASALLAQLARGGSLESAAEDLLISSSAKTYLELVVRNSYYSPRIESSRSLERTDRQLYGSACSAGTAWALLWSSSSSPSAACDAAALRVLLKDEPRGNSSGFARAPRDLQLRPDSGKGVVVLYGAVSASGLPSLSPLLVEVESLPKASSWEVLFRHADGLSGAEGLGADLLTGYGFELAIKSSEYKTHAEEKKDDEKDDKAEDASPADAEGDLDISAPTDHQELDGPLEIDGLLFHVLLKRYPSVRHRVWAFKEQLEVERDTDQILKAWEIKDIGLQATAKIKSSPAPLLALMRLSQNLPAHVVGLSRTSVPETLRKAGKALRERMRDGAEVFSINGRVVRPDHSELSLFPLMNTLHPFFVGVERLARLGVSESVACEILKEVKGSGSSAGRLDWRSKKLPQPLYAVEKDRETQRWPENLQSLLFGFGGLSPVRLPLYQIVFAFDPAEVENLLMAASLLQQMPLPANLYLVMLPPSGPGSASVAWEVEVLGEKPAWLAETESSSSSDEASVAIAAAYGQLLEKGRKRAQQFVLKLAEAAQKRKTSDPSGQRWPNTKEGIQEIKQIWAPIALKAETEAEDTMWSAVLRNASASGGSITAAKSYADSIGVPLPSVLVNGKLMLKNAYEGQHAILQTVAEEQQRLQQAVYMGLLAEGDDVSSYFLSKGVLSAYHPAIAPDMAERGGEEGMQSQKTEAVYHLLPAAAFLELKFLDSLEVTDDDPESSSTGGTSVSFYHVLVLRSLSQAYLLQAFASHLLAPARDSGPGDATLSSHWSVLVDSTAGDLETFGSCIRGVLRLEVEAAEFESKRSVNRQKLSVLKFLGMAVSAATASDPSLPAARVKELCRLAIEKKVELELRPRFQAALEDTTDASEEEAVLLSDVATGGSSDGDMSPQSAVWVCNGRRVDLEDGGQPISARHVLALELLEAQYDLGEAVQEDEGSEEEKALPSKALSEWLATEALPASAYGLAAAIRSEALSHGKNERFTQPARIFEMAPPAFRLHLPRAKPEAASPITVYGILDPLSTTAQSASAALALFGMAFNAEVKLVLNPPMRVTEYPVKRYYREVVRWPERLADGRKLAEIPDGEAVGSGVADFTLATQHTLTAAVHALPTWLVTANKAEYDMDNLRPVEIGVGNVCQTTYQLRQLYVEGQAMILGRDGWPIATAKGLQFQITGKGAREATDDTIVMGNLGYFQVRGDPGLYQATLKSGLSNNTFELVAGSDLEVSSYITPPHQLRVKLQPNRKHDDLFVEEGDVSTLSGSGGGIFSALKSMFTGSPSGKASNVKDEVKDQGEKLETIHIFSVASGHLYEKLLGIMILSVRNNTKNPLHFWFIDNFLSPKFKAFIPLLAERHNFNYDFVTYKWPSWLNPQSEKQRLIWAYKILFFDVLFPQDVPKIIYIDADQVVRADVRELWDLDLKGKVYGFTPMGDTNPDTEGFRFWKHGYWKSHLGDKPYHISALFVVDLKEFRRTNTGDSLRGIYNQLSRDPNSLANLDQDLPNFAQHQVEIHSLPPEWLWCETWCSQESKPFAKTIDLCQNPLTKEPKIVMARRIISEWQTYHDEVQRFQEGLEAGASVTSENSQNPSTKAEL